MNNVNANECAVPFGVVEHAPASLLVNEAEARRLLGGLCPKTMYNLRRRGLPHVKIGARTMYCPSDLAAWVRQQKSPGK